MLPKLSPSWVAIPPMVLASLLVGSAVCCVLGLVYFRACQRRWSKTLSQFSKRHHKTQIGGKTSNDRVLLIVSPASGGGAAIRMFPKCIQAFEQRGAHVHIYVTNGSKDVMGLVQRNDLKPYNCIAVLAGDSTMTELIQSSLVQYEFWPFAPILHLPGGTANVLAAEIATSSATCSDIIQTYSKSKVRLASVIKAYATGASPSKPQYSLHVWGAGIQEFITDALEQSRAGFYAAFGKIGIDMKILETLVLVPQTFLLCVFNSDYEAKGSNLGFGVSSFDDQMSMVHIPNIRCGLEVLPTILKMSLGIMAKKYRKNTLPKQTDVSVVRNQLLRIRRPAPFQLHADGTSNVIVDCKDGLATFEVVKDAIPFFAC